MLSDFLGIFSFCLAQPKQVQGDIYITSLRIMNVDHPTYYCSQLL